MSIEFHWMLLPMIPTKCTVWAILDIGNKLLLAVLLLHESLVVTVILAIQVRISVRVHEAKRNVLLLIIATVVHIRVLGARSAFLVLLRLNLTNLLHVLQIQMIHYLVLLLLLDCLSRLLRVQGYLILWLNVATVLITLIGVA